MLYKWLITLKYTYILHDFLELISNIINEVIILLEVILLITNTITLYIYIKQYHRRLIFAQLYWNSIHCKNCCRKFRFIE